MRPVLLVILDGWGWRAEGMGNAIAQARTPCFDRLWRQYPHTLLEASGPAVGLPVGQVGNSEVGHLTLGSGRILDQDFTRIQKAVADGSLASNPCLLEVLRQTKERGGQLHLLGLLSDGGVHSHVGHIMALLRLAVQMGITHPWVHAFLDGRDVMPGSAPHYLRQLEAVLQECGGGLATVMGRFYAMDRDKRWERTERAYRALVYGEGERTRDVYAALAALEKAGITDEFVPPLVLTGDQGRTKARLQSGDTYIFCNFRPDRARQLSQALRAEVWTEFVRGAGHPTPLYSASLTQYGEGLADSVLFPSSDVTETLGQVISEAGMTQLRIAETEKYPHVTWFLNGGSERVLPGEKRIMVPSPRVRTYDLQPEMSAQEVTTALIDHLATQKLDWGVLNLANPDMVGHSGQLLPTIQAVETVDACLAQIVAAVQAQGGALLITADHGNAEMVTDEQGRPHTAHTLSPVPCILVGPMQNVSLRQESGELQDIAPTVLGLLGLPVPTAMTGRSLIVES